MTQQSLLLSSCISPEKLTEVSVRSSALWDIVENLITKSFGVITVPDKLQILWFKTDDMRGHSLNGLKTNEFTHDDSTVIRLSDESWSTFPNHCILVVESHGTKLQVLSDWMRVLLG